MKSTGKALQSAFCALFIMLLFFVTPESSDAAGFFLASCLDNPITYLRFSEGSGTSTADEVDPRILTVAGHADWTTGKVGSGLSFDGISQGLEIEDDPDFDWSLSDNFSIELWCKTNATDKDIQVIIGRETAGSTHWWVGLNYQRKPAFYLYDENGTGGGIIGPDSINDGQWHHIAVKHTGISGLNELYVDGILRTDSVFNYTAGYNSSANINIGKFYSQLANKFFFQGELDEIAVMNHALTDEQIYEHYIKGAYSQDYCSDFTLAPIITTHPDTLAIVDQIYAYDLDADGYPIPLYDLAEAPAGMTIDQFSGKITWTPSVAGEFMISARASNGGGSTYQNFKLVVLQPCLNDLISYLRFDEGEGSITLDVGNLQIIQIEGNALWGEGKVGAGLSFEGNTNGLSIDPHPVYNWERSQNFSIELWFRSSSEKPDIEVLLGRDVQDSTHWWLGLNADKQAAFYLYDRQRNGGGIYGDISLNDGEWHHLAAVYTGSTGYIRLYTDGQLSNEQMFAYTDDFYASVPIQVGSLFYTGSYKFVYEGQIDEILFLDRGLSEEEIYMHYLKGLHDAGYCEDILLAPMITSIPVEESYSHTSYSYNIEALGIPVPEFSLISGPDGMSINAQSGLIKWNPANGGDYEVEVLAENELGDDTQNFTIHVTESCIVEGISYFNFDETGGNSIEDQIGDQQGQLVNGPIRQTGIVGNSIFFNGLDQSIVIADEDDVFDFPQGSGFSFEVWCKPAIGNSNLQVFLGRNEEGGVHWWIGLQAGSGLPVVYAFDENRLGNGVEGTTDISDGNWHHVVATYSDQEEKLKLYVDGSEDAAIDVSFSAGFSSDAIVQIASLFVDGNFKYFYEGELDEIVIYNRMLTSDEISLHFTLGQLGYGYCFTAKPENTYTHLVRLSQDFRIFPVPATEKLFIESVNVDKATLDIQLYNAIGLKVLDKVIDFSGRHELDISGLSHGSYMVRILEKNELLIWKRILIY